jgi:hypothetical protein
VHTDLEKGDNVHQEAMGPCLSFDMSLVENMSCSYEMHNDVEEESNVYQEVMRHAFS